MSTTLKNTLAVFASLIIILFVFARDQVAALFQVDFGLSPIMPTWVTQDVIPQALLTLQQNAHLTWILAYVVAIVTLVNLFLFGMQIKDKVPRLESLRQYTAYALPLLFALSHVYHENYTLYHYIVTRSEPNLYQWQLSLDTPAYQAAFVITVLVVMLANWFSSDEESHTINLIGRNLIALPVLALGTAVYTHAPVPMLALLATYVITSLFIAINCYNIENLNTSEADIPVSAITSMIAIAFWLWMPTSNINITADFQKPATVQYIQKTNDSLTGKLTVRGLDGKPKQVILTTHYSTFQERTNVTIDKTTRIVKRFEQPFAGEWSSASFVLLLMGLMIAVFRRAHAFE